MSVASETIQAVGLYLSDYIFVSIGNLWQFEKSDIFVNNPLIEVRIIESISAYVTSIIVIIYRIPDFVSA